MNVPKINASNACTQKRRNTEGSGRQIDDMIDDMILMDLLRDAFPFNVSRSCGSYVIIT